MFHLLLAKRVARIATLLLVSQLIHASPQPSDTIYNPADLIRRGFDPPKTWQENWYHDQLVDLKFVDDHVAVYFDKDVDKSIKWPNTFLSQVWKYTKNKYGTFGADPHLYAIFHTDKYGGGRQAPYVDADHDYRNVIDCGKPGQGAWKSGTGNDLDIPTHEVAHLVEGSSKNVKESPAFEIWGDSKWAEIFMYDVYLGIGRHDEAKRAYDMWMSTSDDFPRKSTYWFRDWFYPIYAQLGSPDSLNKFFVLLSQYFPKHKMNNGRDNIDTYSRIMNLGEFIHFYSGAADIDLKPLALTAFGDRDKAGNDWTTQLEQARTTFSAVAYPKDVTSKASLTVSTDPFGKSAAEGSLKLIDSNYKTKFFAGKFSGKFWAKLTFATLPVVRGYTITAANDFSERDPKSWKLTASTDGTNFSQLDSRTDEKFENRLQTRKFFFNNNKAYKYYMLTVTDSNGSRELQIGEWRVLQ